MGCRDRAYGREGFTLLELLVSLTILVAVLSVCYQLLGSTLKASDIIEKGTRPDKIGEGIMALFRRDLQGAVWYRLGKEVFLLENRGEGENARDEIHFLTTAPPLYAAERDLGYVPWSGVTSVSYILRPSKTADGCFTLFRRESIEIGENPFDRGTYFEVYDKVKFLDFLVFDGSEWIREWDSTLRYEKYYAEMKNAIEEFIDSVTKVPVEGAKKSGSSDALSSHPELRRLLAGAGRGEDLKEKQVGAGLEGEEESFFPLPNWAVPRAVRIELGILVGSERGLYRVSPEPDAPPAVYTYSATVLIPSALSVRLRAKVGRFPGQVGAPMVAGPSQGSTPNQERSSGSSTSPSQGSARSGARTTSPSSGGSRVSK